MPGKVRIVGPEIPNLPWQEKPQGCSDVIWRYTANPVIGRYAIHKANSVFNSAVVPWEGGFIGVFRCDNVCMRHRLYVGRSPDGLKWDFETNPLQFVGGDKEIFTRGGYDPRVVKIDDKYYVTWCNNYHGATIGMAWTTDFKEFHLMENAFLPFNRNGVLFPRKVNGYYLMLSRPSDNAHTPFGEIYLSQSPDLEFWGRHRHVLRGNTGWDWLKIGPGPMPIETSEGWLMLYHGVVNTCTGYVYRAGVALLDLEQPWKVKANAKAYVLTPSEPYEMVGDVPNVVFPCAALADAKTGRMAIYYGAADTVVGLGFTTVDTLLQHIKDTQDTEDNA
ncbi:glycosidase [Opitutaceae bacterium EW11]|nr:glycosidase [Opitutaceae bacterium EW11]